jgi:hypothetical protein|tara:strand:- start:1195 stop:1887 length:693 start_codon:yes stop_codon:yes gene_type:complete
MMGLFDIFKKKLSEHTDKYTVNYLISEEAGQQWQFHVIENNFQQEAFRGLPFAKNTLNLFVQNYLKMKVDDQLLSTIADMGYRKCREWIDNHLALEKIIKKKKYDNLLKTMGAYVFFVNEMNAGTIFKDLKFDHDKAISEGMGDVDFRKKFKNYNVMMQIMREMYCYTNVLIKHKKSLSLIPGELDGIINNEEQEILKLSTQKKSEILKKIEKDGEAIFMKRNLFNEMGN